MDIVDIVLKVALTLCSIFLVVLVLLQQGKGADAGAAFGGGASQTVFGSGGSGNFLTKSTWWLGFIFFACALALAFKAQNHQVLSDPESVMLELPAAVEGDLPGSDVPIEVPLDEMADFGGSESDVPVLGEAVDDAEVVDRSGAVADDMEVVSDLPPRG